MRWSFRRRAIFAVALCLGPWSGAHSSARGAGSDLATDLALAQRYENAEGVPLDYGRALQLYCDAAEQGNATAAFSVGWMYLNARGVARDDAIAVAWLRVAADRGDEQAKRVLMRLAD